MMQLDTSIPLQDVGTGQLGAKIGGALRKVKGAIDRRKVQEIMRTSPDEDSAIGRVKQLYPQLGMQLEEKKMKRDSEQQAMKSDMLKYKDDAREYITSIRDGVSRFHGIAGKMLGESNIDSEGNKIDLSTPEGMEQVQGNYARRLEMLSKIPHVDPKTGQQVFGLRNAPKTYDSRYIKMLDDMAGVGGKLTAEEKVQRKMAAYDAVQVMPEGPEKEEAWQKFVVEHPVPGLQFTKIGMKTREEGAYGVARGQILGKASVADLENELAVRRKRAVTKAGIEQTAETSAKMATLNAKTRGMIAAEEASQRVLATYQQKAKLPGSFQSIKYETAVYGLRMEQANRILNMLDEDGFDPSSIKNALILKAEGDWWNVFKSEKLQAYAQAVRNYINASLRRESGAAIAEHEYISAIQQGFPKVSDKKLVKRNKIEGRAIYIAGFKADAGHAWKEVENNIELLMRPIKERWAEIDAEEEGIDVTGTTTDAIGLTNDEEAVFNQLQEKYGDVEE